MRDVTIRLRAVRGCLVGAAMPAVVAVAVAIPVVGSAGERSAAAARPAGPVAPVTAGQEPGAPGGQEPTDPTPDTGGDGDVDASDPDGGSPAGEGSGDGSGDAGDGSGDGSGDEGSGAGEDPAPGSTASDDPDVDWGSVLAVGVGVVILLAVLAALLAAARRRAAATRAINRGIAEVVGRARWVHDEGALGVLDATGSPDRLQTVWQDTRRRIDDVASQASRLATDAPDEGTNRRLRALNRSLDHLLGALDTHASLHLQLSDDPSLWPALEGATDTVMQRRADLLAAIRPLAAQI